MDNLVKVTNAQTGELKRWESSSGKPLAILEDSKLILTQLGKRLGYRIDGDYLER